MSLRRRALLLAFAWLPLAACTGSTAASTAPAAPKAAKAARNSAAAAGRGAVPPAGAGALEPLEAYSYQSDGRRDPFLNILNSGSTDPKSTIQKGEGAASLLINEVVVRAIASTSTKVVAMVQGPDGRNYNIHAGDKFADGTVKSITPTGLVIMQDVNDPLSTAKQREVKKLLRSLEDAKQ